MKLRVLDLFSGIGGFSLGLERTGGFETVAFCEIDAAARNVLERHWAGVPVFDDVTKLKGSDIDGAIDVICGGFPCQDISTAGKQAGIVGQRSGLWREFHRLIGEIRPQYAIIENVSALRSKGLTLVLQNLCEVGYRAEWHCIPASAIGALHRRDRVWIVATRLADTEHDGQPATKGCEGIRGEKQDARREAEQGGTVELAGGSTQPGVPGDVAIPSNRILRNLTQSSHWRTEPSVGRMAHGVSGRVDRLKQLGNAVVPQIPQMIGEALLAAHRGDAANDAAPKFADTHCSQCGRSFGPGSKGFSHCSDHAAPITRVLR